MRIGTFNNVAKFILSIGPQTTGEKGIFQIDLEDDAVQNMLITYNGEKRWPDKITPYSQPPPPKPYEPRCSVYLSGSSFSTGPMGVH